MRCSLILRGSSPTQNKSPHQISGTATIGPRKGPFKVPLIFLWLDVPNLQILMIGDIPCMSTISVMPFHNHDTKMIFSGSKMGARNNIVDYIAQLFFRVDLFSFLREYCTVPRLLCRVRKQLKRCLCFHLILPRDYQPSQSEEKICSSNREILATYI